MSTYFGPDSYHESVVAIRDHQWPSVVISGNQRPSVTISGNQRPSVAISGHQCPSSHLLARARVIGRVDDVPDEGSNHWPSGGHPGQSEGSCNCSRGRRTAHAMRPSSVISGNQWQSVAIRRTARAVRPSTSPSSSTHRRLHAARGPSRSRPSRSEAVRRRG